MHAIVAVACTDPSDFQDGTCNASLSFAWFGLPDSPSVSDNSCRIKPASSALSTTLGSTMTPARCAVYCYSSNNSTFVGLDFLSGGTCYCYSTLPPTISTQCDQPCTNSMAQGYFCGGDNSVNVYKPVPG